MFASWEVENRRLLASSHFLTSCGLYSRSATGKFNLGTVFVDLGGSIIGSSGLSGMLSVSGIATDDAGAEFISWAMSSGRLVALYDFENKRGLFPAVDSRLKFCAIVMRGKDARGTVADFVFFAHSTDELREPGRRIQFDTKDIDLLNPLSRTCPVFRNSSVAVIVKRIYEKAKLKRTTAKVLFQWDVRPTFMFVMSDHSSLFVSSTDLSAPRELSVDDIPLRRNGKRYLPLFESKMFHQFDHRWKSLGGGEDERPVPRDNPRLVAAPRAN